MPFGLQEVETNRISRQSAYEVGKVVSSTHWLFFPPIRNPLYSFLLEAKLTPMDIVWLQALSQ